MAQHSIPLLSTFNYLLNDAFLLGLTGGHANMLSLIQRFVLARAEGDISIHDGILLVTPKYKTRLTFPEMVAFKKDYLTSPVYAILKHRTRLALMNDQICVATKPVMDNPERFREMLSNVKPMYGDGGSVVERFFIVWGENTLHFAQERDDIVFINGEGDTISNTMRKTLPIRKTIEWKGGWKPLLDKRTFGSQLKYGKTASSAGFYQVWNMMKHNYPETIFTDAQTRKLLAINYARAFLHFGVFTGLSSYSNHEIEEGTEDILSKNSLNVLISLSPHIKNIVVGRYKALRDDS
ncbi:glycosyl hydrolase domain protein [Ranid herpesvirus 3]|uniref:Glycosyl hydrolase domain protein n=1 Tax=Ranid herpesvirus 3 TaxID=1987509 RepID=A0A1X9T5A8_9VIRU|nr:glycosyl hydrolase domain protein [Ranid herpesvirus 3]ARR28835.1 glycosyl hydrolase domain protein [Ranid herpesvirus 3]